MPSLLAQFINVDTLAVKLSKENAKVFSGDAGTIIRDAVDAFHNAIIAAQNALASGRDIAKVDPAAIAAAQAAADKAAADLATLTALAKADTNRNERIEAQRKAKEEAAKIVAAQAAKEAKARAKAAAKLAKAA